MKKIPLWAKVLGMIVFGYLFFFYPIPYYLQMPGGALELDDVVEVDGQFFDEPGSYMMTTVGMKQATPFTSFMQFLPYYDLVSKQEVLGNIEDHEQYIQIQRYFMNSSIHEALIVAFEAADAEYELDYHGIYVMSVISNSDFSDQLEIGDTVVEIDGHRFESSEEFIDYVAEQEVGQEVDLVYERQGEEHHASGDLIELDSGLPGIGISLVDNTTVVTDPEVVIHSGNIGGPSAGLMFALQVYSLLENQDLRGGRDIAGTGTISEDGSVGRIGGVDKKVVAADREGASVFFVPDDEIPPEALEANPDYQSNYEEAEEMAERIGTDMEIVPINHFEEAIEYLEQLDPVAFSTNEVELSDFLLAS